MSIEVPAAHYFDNTYLHKQCFTIAHKTEGFLDEIYYKIWYKCTQDNYTLYTFYDNQLYYIYLSVYCFDKDGNKIDVTEEMKKYWCGDVTISVLDEDNEQYGEHIRNTEQEMLFHISNSFIPNLMITCR